jgi:hypothetical protein
MTAGRADTGAWCHNPRRRNNELDFRVQVRNQGNTIDMAVGIIIGAALAKWWTRW